MSVVISERSFSPRRPYLVVGVPEAGLVGSIAASYMAQRLALPEVGYLDSDLFPPIVVVHDGEPRSPFRIFGREDLVIVNAEVPASPELYSPIAQALTAWGRDLQSPLMIGMTGLPSRQRLEVERPRVFALSSSPEVRESFRRAGSEAFQEGFLVGFYAQLMRACLKAGQPNLTLLAESHLQFPDPGAAAGIVAQLSAYLSLGLDVSPLIEESEQIRLRTRELMNKTLESMSKVASGLYA